MMARRHKGRPVSGWLNFDKPADMSSAQAVARLRHLFQAEKAGHAGTLDPQATGVLPIAFGEATKTVRYLMAARKTYQVTVKWGEATRTDDGEGAIYARSDKRPDCAMIEKAIKHFSGPITQRPPAWSALKLAGQRAYHLARAGKIPQLAPRRVHIFAINLLAMPDADHAVFEVVCGKGVYIRALARDMGVFCGTRAHVAALRRCQVGIFTQKHALGLEKLEVLGHTGERESAASTADAMTDSRFATLDRLLQPIITVLHDIPAVQVTGAEAEKIRFGQPIAISAELADRKEGIKESIDDAAGTGAAESVDAAEGAGNMASPHVLARLGDRPVAIGSIRQDFFHPDRVFTNAC